MRIILFGSHATGHEREGSDTDLLIVKETDKRPIDRRIEVERLLWDRKLALDILVYAPREVRDLYMLGSPFIEEVVERGRVLYVRKATGAWLAEAQEDMESADVLLDHGTYRAACFHSQQYVEKGLKALILERGRRPARTHGIVDLWNFVRTDGWTVTLLMDDAVFLKSVYRGRCPTDEGFLPHGAPTGDDARRALEVADACRTASVPPSEMPRGSIRELEGGAT